MRPITNNQISIHEATNLFLRLFEDFSFIQITEFLYGLDEFTGEEVTRKDLIHNLKMDQNQITRVFKGLRQLKIVERRVLNNRCVFYKLKKERFETLKQHYEFLSKKLTA